MSVFIHTLSSPELSEYNQKELSKSSHLIISIIDPDNKKDQKVLEGMIEIAKEFQATFSHSGQVIRFAWLDGLKFSHYVTQVYGFEPKEYPRYVVTVPKEDIYYKKHVLSSCVCLN